MEVERLYNVVYGAPVTEIFCLMVQTVQTVVDAQKSVYWLLFLVGSISNSADALADLLEAEKRFPFSELNKVSSPDVECKDDGESEDDSDDDEDADVGDDSDDDAEDSSGDEDDDEQGDADSDSDANDDDSDANDDDDDDDDEDDDDDDEDDEDDDDDEDDEEEEGNQPPFKKKK